MRANGGKLVAHECGEAVFVQLFGPLQLCVPKPCLSGPPFVPPATTWVFSVAGSFLGFLWRSLPRLCLCEGADGCPSAAIWGSLRLSPPCFLCDFQAVLGAANTAAGGERAHFLQSPSPPGTAVSAPTCPQQHPVSVGWMLSPSQLGYHRVSWSWAWVLASGVTCQTSLVSSPGGRCSCWWWCCPLAGASLVLGTCRVRHPEAGGLQFPTSLESN